jgi:hypothetical protein
MCLENKECQMASAGRTPLSKLEKTKRKASRDYRKITEKRNLSYNDMYEKRAGNKNMGRKPVGKDEQIKRAKAEFLDSLFEHRAEAREVSIILPDIRSLLREYQTYRASDSAGRKGSDRVITLHKYIEKETVKLKKAKAEPCPMEKYNGRGRKPMSKIDRIEHYENKIKEASDEIAELMNFATPSQSIYYELRTERIEVRRLKQMVAINPLHDMAIHELAIHEETVAELEKKYNNQIAKEKKETAPSSATSVSSVAMSFPNSDLENETLITSTHKAIAPTNLSGHEEIELMKVKELAIDEELKSLDDLEEILRARYLLLKQKRELKEAIESKQRQLLN